MTIQKQIAFARRLIDNPTAYARVMSAAIRSAMSTRAINAYRAAVEVDGMVDAFDNWSSDCPTAKVEA